MRRCLALPLGAALLAVIGACVQVLDIEEDRVYQPPPPTPPDLTNDPRWSCLQEGSLAGVTVSDQRTPVVIAVDTFKAGALHPFGFPRLEATVTACSPAVVNTGCQKLSTTEVTQTSGEARVAPVTLTGPFTSFFQVTTGGTPSTFLPQFVYDDRLRTGTGFDPADSVNNAVIATLLNRQGWVEVAGPSTFKDVPRIETHGFMYVEVYDCEGVLANGLSFEIDLAQPEVTKTYYIQNGRTSIEATETLNGGGGFFNIPANNRVKLTVREAATQGLVVQREVDVQVGTNTQVNIGPKRPASPPPPPPIVLAQP